MAERSRGRASTLAISRSVSPRAPDKAIAMALPIENGESTILPPGRELPEQREPAGIVGSREDPAAVRINLLSDLPCDLLGTPPVVILSAGSGRHQYGQGQTGDRREARPSAHEAHGLPFRFRQSSTPAHDISAAIASK